ncbi:MAG: hypothetical protein IPP07_09525 [Holophagales bacterium]|nr:hypothetical protein [Holophagales bacterium]MBK9965110.1 hypothetical protein [Holophagales bacterium]
MAPADLAVLLLFALAGAEGGALAQGVPLSPGQAPVVLAAPAQVGSGRTFTVGLKADLTGRTGTCAAATVPLVLGGYALSVRFDPQQVLFVSAAGGGTSQFSSAPAFTNPAFANVNGSVLLNAIQGNAAAPTGLVEVAVLTFRAAPGATSALLTAEPASVALTSATQSCAAGGSAGPVSIPAVGQSVSVSIAGTGFFPLTPCRVFDTRFVPNAPALDPGQTRVFHVTGACGIDASAVAISVNLTVAQAAATGELQAFPGNGLLPGTSALSFRAGGTRANNEILLLATDGSGSIAIHNGSSGTVHVILDVNGTFR